MFAHAEEIEAAFVGQFDFLKQMTHPLCRTYCHLRDGIGLQGHKTVDADLQDRGGIVLRQEREIGRIR